MGLLVFTIDAIPGDDIALWLRTHRDHWEAILPVWNRSGNMLAGMRDGWFLAPALLVLSRLPQAHELAHVAKTEWGAITAIVVDGDTAREWIGRNERDLAVVHIDWSPHKEGK
jgi:hypothetical protein